MHRPLLEQDHICIQQGLDLLKAYTEITDPRVRDEILARVLEIRDGLGSACQTTQSPTLRPAAETGADLLV